MVQRSVNNNPGKKISRRSVLLSLVLLLISGYFVAVWLHPYKWGWLFASLYYGTFILCSLLIIAGIGNLKRMLGPSLNNKWNLLPFIFIIPIIFNVFIPNLGLLKPDYWLALNIFICLVNPWLEEFYWRGMIHQAFKDKPVVSLLISAVGFGLSHPLILGINSLGVRGVLGFIGVFAVGLIFWWCYYKTKSLRGCIFTHFLIDLFGMSVYILANKAVLMIER
jgi:membrane protease YdiL (CAAX protease family)